MSDQIDNMLKEMEEFNKKYGFPPPTFPHLPLKSQPSRKRTFSKTQKKSPAIRPQPSELVLPAP